MPPVLHPITHQPSGPADLEPSFSKALIEQEVSKEREIEIPGPHGKDLLQVQVQGHEPGG